MSRLVGMVAISAAVFCLGGKARALPLDEYEAISAKFGRVSVVVGATFVPAAFKERRRMIMPGYSEMSKLITSFDLRVDGEPVMMPGDAFAGLGDPVSVDIPESDRRGVWRLLLRGGDGSTAYCAAFEFNHRRVQAVKLYENCRAKLPYAVKQYPASGVTK